MNPVRNAFAWIVPVAVLLAGGCATSRVDFSGIVRPARAPELDAYNTFVGSWTWEAEMLNAEEPDRLWNGTAEWRWTLDDRCLEGNMSSKSRNTEFTATGIWSWHPRSKKYIWSMFNNWGYPQEGTASYDDVTRTWKMRYTSVGLDGTTSYGRYRITVVDDNTLEWTLKEWADPIHLVTKIEMKGVYKRK